MRTEREKDIVDVRKERDDAVRLLARLIRCVLKHPGPLNHYLVDVARKANDWILKKQFQGSTRK